MSARRAAVLALLGLSACPLPQFPGDQSMGTWAMTATPSGTPSPSCNLPEFLDADAGPFTFQMVLTRDSASEAAWVTLAGYSRDAGFDGQYLSSTAEARRVLCGECQTRLIETISVSVLSRSQAEALNGRCPGRREEVPTPDADAGIFAPRNTAEGYDAVRLCGTLSTEVAVDGLADGGACDQPCDPCPTTFSLRGERR